MLKVLNSSNGISYERVMSLINYDIPVGDTANVLNGYSYANLRNGFQVYTPNKDLDNLVTSIRRFIYLPDYNTKIGIDHNIPSPERVICDFLMYPDKLSSSLYLLDAMEGYVEEYGNFDKVYEMMSLFNIPKEKLDDFMPYMWQGSNCGAID